MKGGWVSEVVRERVEGNRGFGTLTSMLTLLTSRGLLGGRRGCMRRGRVGRRRSWWTACWDGEMVVRCMWSVRRGYGGTTDEARNLEVLWIVMDADWTALLLIGGLGLCKDFYVPARDTGILDLK